MLNFMQSRRKFIWLYLALIVAAVIVAAHLSANLVEARRGGGPACIGTYLVEVAQAEAPTHGLWTFSWDGTAHKTDSSEQSVGFSHQQGAWKRTSYRNAEATFINFSLDPATGEHTGYARIEKEIQFSNNCQEISGNLDLFFYPDPTADPLDRGAEDSSILDVQFNGRRVNAG